MAAKYHGKKLTELKGDALRARIKTLAANPATRSKVPAQYLTGNLAKFAKQRALNTRLAQPVVPGSQMTEGDLARQANAAMKVQYGPEHLALNQALASNPLEAKRDSDWYDQYLGTLKAANTTAGTNAQNVADRVSGVGTSGQTAALASSDRMQAQMGSDAQARGASVDPSVGREAAQGAVLNKTLADAQAGTALAMGQAQQGFLQTLLAAANAGKISALNDVAGKKTTLQGQQRELAQREGAGNLEYRGKARQTEAQNVATNIIASGNQALGKARVDVAQQNADTSASRAKTTAKTAKTTSDRADATFAASHQGYTPTQFAALSPGQQLAILKRVAAATHPKTGKKGAKPGKPSTGLGSLPPAQETKFASQANQVASILRNPPKTPDGKTATREQVVADIRAGSSPLGKGIDPRVINIGMSLADNNGALGPWGQRNAHNLGVHVNKRWKTVKGKKKTAPAGPAGPVG